MTHGDRNGFVTRAAIGPVGGERVMGAAGAIMRLRLTMALVTMRLRHSVEVFKETHLSRMMHLYASEERGDEPG